ncbi:MAG: trypsin-like peptidase domain-containing protein [Oscillospiraceae bacterium]|nr:trypsin-like peptidase domain-containing protein [Oscillospiraceae bacterium]
MYENNYNYIDVPEEKEKKKSGAGKTAALILSVALVGGASGFGGAYLQSRLAGQEMTAQESISVPAVNSKPEGSVNLGDQGVGTVSSLLAADRNGSLTTKQIVEKVSPSVVSVHSDFSGQTATGTGIILSEAGYIITNAHVIQTEGKERVTDGGRNNINPFSGGYDDIFEYFFGGGVSYKSVLKNADEVTVILSGDEETEYKAEIIGADPYSDIAVLKIEGTGFAAAEFGDSNELTMGDKAVAIGYPLGLGLSTSEGIISGLNRSISVELSGGGTAEMILIQTDAAINPGNSGGPLINEYGQVIGITSSKISTYTVEGMGFAIPITDAMPIISDIMNNNNTTPQIGISGTDINSAYARYYNLPVNKGVMVGSVMEGGAADAAGICAGDIIVAADGKEITSMDELSAAKARKKVGDKMVLTLARADGNVDVEIILTAEENEEDAAS